MKISIGINGFKQYNDLNKREKLCLESLIKIKEKNNNIKLYNICFENENIEYKNFITLNSLRKKSSDIIHTYFQAEGLKNEYNLRKNEINNNKKHLPSVKEIFDVLASTDCDYFLFLNNDIILSNRVLKEIEEDNFDCYPVSRMHIYDIDTLDDTPELESYSIHGFDAFLVKKNIWKTLRNNFEDLILGRFYWDTYFATLFNLLCKCKNLNKLPPVCFHIEHKSTSNSDTIENYYNEDVFKRNTVVGQFWFSYVQNVLLKRQAVGKCKWYQPFANEIELEKRHFGYFDQEQFINSNFKKLNVTTKQDYDLFIPVAPKDEIKLPFTIEHARKNLNSKKIFVCSPHNITNKVVDSNIVYINDKDVLDVSDRSFIGFRPNWTYQQFLKLFFNLSESEYFFALDSDTIITKPLPLFKDKHPIWYYGWSQNHLPYFLFNKKVFNLDKALPHTGIGDLGLFNKQITKTFLNYCNCQTPKDLLYKIGNKTNALFHFSEYETYANFIEKYYNELYIFEHIKQENKGKDLNRGEQWTEKDIKDTIEQNLTSNKSIISLHSWKL
jgi:hypothetical protein